MADISTCPCHCVLHIIHLFGVFSSRKVRWTHLDPPEFVEWLQGEIGGDIFNMDKMNEMLNAVSFQIVC